VVALVVGWHPHQRARPDVREHEISDVDGNLLAGNRVLGVRIGEHATFLLGFVVRIEVVDPFSQLGIVADEGRY